MLSVLGQFAAEARDIQQGQLREAQNALMNRHALIHHAMQGFNDHENPFVRRASLGSGLQLGNGKKRPKIEIHLDGQPADFRIPSYTTRERIVGHVQITAACDIPFDDLHVSLQGTSRTWVEKIATTAPTNPRTRAFHTFLRLLQPIEESEMPEQHILRAGRIYNIPFEFVVPEHLLPQTCSHARENAHVEEEHLKPPPSLGDAMVSGDGKSLYADHAPEMTTITYSLRCILTKNPTSSSSRRPTMIADEQKKLRIIPKFDELPPLVISDEPGEDYVTHKTKKIKKGILMGKTLTGRLHVDAKQPAALRLPGVRITATPDAVAPVTTYIKVKMSFEPEKSNFKPPKLQTLWTRLKVATFFATVPQKSIPTKSAAFSADINKGLMVETVPLASLCLVGVQWVKREEQRRDSGYGFDSRKGSVDHSGSDESPLATPVRSPTPTPATTPAGEDGPGRPYYTAEVTVPVELPYQKHAFLPTFHSCLISRIYAIDLSIMCSTGAGTSSNIHLKIPVQVTSTGSKDPVPLDGMIPEGGFVGARADHRDAFAPNRARAEQDADEPPPDFDELSIHENNAAAVAAAAAAEQPEVDSDGEINFRRPRWTCSDAMQANDPGNLAAALERQHFDPQGTRSPEAGSPGSRTPVIRTPLGTGPDAMRRASADPATGARSPGTRSPSPSQMRLTNDQILNTEDYDNGNGPASPELAFGSITFEPQSFARPGDGINRGAASNGQWRRASEVLPPGYASVAAGTMLMGTGGLVRALN